MDAETLRRSVEPFFTTKPPGRGTGLGLSQVYGFASQSGGAVHIESRPGAGTSVGIFLPRSVNETMAPDPDRSGEHQHPGGLVLVVEDEHRVAELACQLLVELGYECEHAPDATEALRRDLARFAAVISDVIMPGPMDGIALAKEVRKRAPHLPILLTTGFVDAPERIEESGFPTLAKPYSFDQLSAAMASLMQRRGSRQTQSAFPSL